MGTERGEGWGGRKGEGGRAGKEGMRGRVRGKREREGGGLGEGNWKKACYF